MGIPRNAIEKVRSAGFFISVLAEPGIPARTRFTKKTGIAGLLPTGMT
jgi:hypothetical protein